MQFLQKITNNQNDLSHFSKVWYSFDCQSICGQQFSAQVAHFEICVPPSRSVMTEQQKRDEEKMVTDLAYELALEEKRPPTGFAILADAAL